MLKPTLIFSLFFVVTLAACSADDLARAVGAPTREDFDTTAAALADAESQVDALEDAIASSAREVERANIAASSARSTVGELEDAEAQLADKLAKASPAERAPLAVALREVQDRLATARANAESAATDAADLSARAERLGVQSERARKRLEDARASFAALESASQEAGKRAGEAVRRASSAVGAYVPGAGAIGDSAAGILELVLGAALGSVGVGAVSRARLKRISEERDSNAEERDGLRNAIRITEHFGISNIANKPEVREAAKLAMAANPGTDAAFRRATKGR